MEVVMVEFKINVLRVRMAALMVLAFGVSPLCADHPVTVQDIETGIIESPVTQPGLFTRMYDKCRNGFAQRVNSMPPWLLDTIVTAEALGEAAAYGYVGGEPGSINYDVASYFGIDRGMRLSDFLSNRSEWNKIGVGFLAWFSGTVVHHACDSCVNEGIGSICIGFILMSCYNQFLKLSRKDR
jgi:hypothetical protein